METRNVTFEQIEEIALRILTKRQIDVLRLWVSGMGVRRIALALDISETTVREHRDRALQKLKIEIESNVYSRGMSLGTGERK